MNIPGHLSLHDALYAFDGGTILLSAFDGEHRARRIELLQHASPRPSHSDGELPGRLYFDGELIALRSSEETALVDLLRKAEFHIASPGDENLHSSEERRIIIGPSEDLKQFFSRSPADDLRAVAAEVVRFVESDDYLRFAVRVEQAADQTRYTVWPAWTTETRKAVAVRLGRLLGVSISAALRYLDEDCHSAKHITALDAADLAERYGAERLSLRVEPDFPWTIQSPSQHDLSQPRRVAGDSL